jgi:uncharacterized protein YuzE
MPAYARSREFHDIFRVNYHPDTDSICIEFSERPSVDSREISEGVVVDYDADGKVVGIDIDNAGNKLDLGRVLISKMPGAVETEAA